MLGMGDVLEHAGKKYMCSLSATSCSEVGQASIWILLERHLTTYHLALFIIISVKAAKVNRPPIPPLLQAYIDGQWPAARDILSECRTARRDIDGRPVVDGPCEVLLGFMEKHKFTAPASWRGFRELTEK